MPDPLIERIKTELYFWDTQGTCWLVADARKRSDGKLWRQYPGSDNAVVRFFTRLKGGAFIGQPAEETRRYTFKEGENRWLIPAEFQRQLNESEA